MAIAIRDKIIENSQQFLQPGEQVQAVLGGQTVSGWWGALSSLMYFWNHFRAVLVTDRRIIVLDSGKVRMGVPKGHVRDLPRSTKIGPPKGLWYRTDALGEKLYIHKRFHKDIELADSLMPGA
jgi:hypothetical protein